MREREEWFKWKPLCAECARNRRIAVAVELDHIVPLHKDGPDHASNKQGLCKPCHEEKTARDMGYTLRHRVVIGDDGYPV